MAKLNARPYKNVKLEQTSIERNFQHLDDIIRKIDERRIAQQTTVSEGSDDAATIQNLLAAVNSLIAALNASDLTND
ncbi:MAG: hypothetical protein KDI38_03630 [Calditrichaeota bacterium]|nr:hypothetical protein [Calditrichota bacterium]